jgi:hypothetical protein
VTGSQPLTASKPLVLHPGLLPVVICCMSAEFSTLEKEREAYVVESTGVLVKGRVKEAHNALVSCQAFLIDQGNDAGENWSGSTSTAYERWRALSIKQNVLAQGSNIWVATSGAIEEWSAIDRFAIRGRAVLEIGRQSGLLVIRSGPVVAESATGVERFLRNSYCGLD